LAFGLNFFKNSKWAWQKVHLLILESFMFNVCPSCGNWHDKRQIDPAGPYAICPDCGYRQPFTYFPLFVITGASGAGKTAVTLALMGQLLDYVLLEGDIFWRPEFNRPEGDYLDFRNICLRAAKSINQSGRPTIISGSATPGQYEACPEFCYFDGVHYLALVCDDEVLERRLRQRPSWRQAGSAEFAENMQAFNGRFKENDHLVTVLDTSHITVAETAESVKVWLAPFQNN
jgi:predicted RNA-binding Zn-ribbon protein involved in translation (DUF1610 family)